MLKAEEMIDSGSTVDAITYVQANFNIFLTHFFSFFCRGVGLDKKDTFGKSGTIIAD